jgi:hypothetical protein
MIIESMVAGITIIFVSSLAFANTQIKRQRKWDEEDSRPTPIPPPPPPEPEPEPEPTIYPFLELRIGTPCPKCLVVAKAATTKEDEYGDQEEDEPAQGPNLPRACLNRRTCAAEKYPHLHAYCNTCGMSWFMAPADCKIVKKELSHEISHEGIHEPPPE